MKKDTVLSIVFAIMTSIAIIMFLVLFILMCTGGFSRSLLSIGEHVQSTLLPSGTEDSVFLEDRTFDKQDIMTSSFDDAVIDQSGTKPFTLSIESFTHPQFDKNTASVFGPFGIKIQFQPGTPASEYGLGDGFVKLQKQRQGDSQDICRVTYYNTSHIYFVKMTSQTEYEILAEISDNKWDSLENNNWSFFIKNPNGSLMSNAGSYRIIIVMSECTLRKNGDNYTLIDRDNSLYSYSVTANDGEYAMGVLQKNGAQNNYKFQLSLNEENRLIVPHSEKLEIKGGSVIKLGITYSDRYELKNASISVYRIDPLTGQSSHCFDVPLKIGTDSPNAQHVSLDFTGYDSGIYKLVVQGEFRLMFFEMHSLDEIFECIAFRTVTEEYEYYFKIGELQ